MRALVVLALASVVFAGCVAPSDDADEGSADALTDVAPTDATRQALFERPADLDTTAFEQITFLKTGATTLHPHPLTEDEGRTLYQAILKQLESRDTFKAAAMHEGAFPSWAASAPCAYSASEFLEYALNGAELDEQSAPFSHHDKMALTHAVEIELRNLGFTYYRRGAWTSHDANGAVVHHPGYVAPRGAMGAWNRYPLAGIRQHSGHVYWILTDNGQSGRNDKESDNGSRYSISYHPGGSAEIAEGFWLPPGVYPQPR